MKVSTLVSNKTLVLGTKDKPCVGPGEALIRVRRVGLCGSDVHYWAHGRCGPFVVDGPIVLGHESAGEVEAVGEGVSPALVGQRVALEPGASCGTCEHCVQGTYNLCGAMRFHATPPVDGTLQEYVVHPARLCFVLPPSVSTDEGALVEPLSVAVHAVDRGHITLGSTVLITGAGPVGLLCLLAAKAAGATQVLVSDLDESRLKLASQLGASSTVKSGQVAALAARVSIDVTLECSGSPAAIKEGLEATRSGGTFVSIGRGGSESVALPFFALMDREVDIRGVFRYRHCYAKAVNLLAQGLINVKPLITHRFGLEEASKAFETCETAQDNAVKVMLEM